MDRVAEAGLEDLWACASAEAMQRVADLARKALRVSAVEVFSTKAGGRIVRCLSDPLRMLVDEAASVGADPQPMNAIDVPIELSCGREIGTLRAIASDARDRSSEDRDLLEELATWLTSQIELKLESVQRQKAEAELERARTHLLAVADRIPGLVFERRKVDAARSRYTFFGTTKSRLPAVRKMMEDGGTGDLGFVHQDDREVVRAAILRSNLEETDLDLTFRIKDFDRRVRWLRSQSIVRRDADGAVFWDGLIFDISDLVAAREDAEVARAAKDKLLLDVDHALRTPLQAIIGFADVLGSDGQAEHASAQPGHIRLAAQSLLSIIDQVVAQAGGPLPGTDLPMEVGAPEAGPRPQPAPANGSPHASAERGGARILLADDLDLNRKLIADMLGLEGHVVECVADGAAAVRMASQYPFDLILMDMIMPVMDGIAATEAIRALPAPACHVPIVALTAHSLHEQLDGCLKAGMDATLTKPMSFDALNAAVVTWTSGRKAA